MQIHGVRACIVLASAVFTACIDTPVVEPSKQAGACVPDDSAAVSEPPNYLLARTFGADEDNPLINVAGMVHSDSTVVVFDAGLPRLLYLTAQLELIRAWGREGKGPQELELNRMPGKQWLDIAADTLVLFDGRQLHFLNLNGQHLRVVRPPGASVSSQIGQIAYSEGNLIFGLGDAPYPPQPDPAHPRFQIFTSNGRQAQELLSVDMAVPPVYQGAPFYGPNEALPLWHIAGHCLALTDGYSTSLLMLNLLDHSVDTVRFTMPPVARKFAQRSQREDERGLLDQMKMRKWPPPARPVRYTAITIDNAGKVWLRLSGSTPSIAHALRVSLATGSSDVVQLPAFPREFMSGGGFIAVTKDPLGRQIVQRYNVAAQR